MSDEATLEVLPAEQITPPAKRKLKLPAGQELIEAIELTTGMTVPAEQREKLMTIQDGFEAAKFLETALLGSDTILTKTAIKSAFASEMFRKIKLPPWLMTMQMQTLAEVDKAIEWYQKRLDEGTINGKEATEEAMIALAKGLTVALDIKTKMMEKASKLAQTVTDAGPEKKGPKNLPPSLSQVNVVVQTSSVEKTQR